ncbi:MAG: uroporphyrinogen decarboxylase family protein [Tepidisphaerales bacterium]
MSQSMEELYQQRLKRYTTALRNEKPDRVPIRPFAAELCAKYAGFNCQQVTQDIGMAFEAVIKTCRDFDWDAAVANMVYVWGGIPQAANLRYYAIPGVGLSPTTGFQYLEPPEGGAWMQADDYDDFAKDPTGWLYNVWLPRISRDVPRPGEPASFKQNLSLLKGGMALMTYFTSFGPHIQRMRTECGTVSAIAGILKAPLDILADKFRGYMGLCDDLVERPEKVKKMCEALMPHMLHIAKTSADPSKTVPIGLWMHRSCVPFISFDHFNNIFWPTLKPIILELHKLGHQVMFYAEGKWGPHLKSFAELPDRSILFHCDRDDIFEVHRILGHKFCISGGVPNAMLSFGKPEEVKACCKKIIDEVARDGGYIMDASAIMQNDTSIENVKAMTDFTREYGVY